MIRRRILFTLLALAGCLIASVAAATSTPRTPAAGPGETLSQVHLREAVFALEAHDLTRAERHLTRCALGSAEAFAEAPRAGYLLASVYLRQGATQRFLDLSHRMNTWPQSTYVKAVATLRALTLAAGADSLAGVAALATAGLRVEDRGWTRTVSAREARTQDLRAAAEALDAEAWSMATGHARTARESWKRSADRLETYRGADGGDRLWAAWTMGSGPFPTLAIDASPIHEALAAWNPAVHGLVNDPRTPELPDAPLASRLEPTEPGVPQPTPEAWRDLLDLNARIDDGVRNLRRLERDRDAELLRIARHEAYLDRGADSLLAMSARLHRLLEATGAHADDVEAWQARLTALAARLAARFEARLAGVAHTARLQQERLHAQTILRRMDPVASGFDSTAVPTPSVVAAGERAFLRALGETAGRAEASWPDRVERSVRDFGPALAAHIVTLFERAARLETRTEAVAAQVAALRDAAGETVRLATLREEHAWRTAELDTLRVEHAALRAWTVKDAFLRAEADLLAEQEGIDYVVLTSLYESARAGDPLLATSADTRRETMTAMEAFLGHHPDSWARAEVRYRLADLMLTHAEAAFVSGMARAGQSGGASPALVDPSPALTLYQAILAEDPDYAHRDAVLHHAGLLLADQGLPRGLELLQALLEEHPRSPYVQEACVRLGDAAFDTDDMASAHAYYSRAVEGDDTDLTAIATYKLGWTALRQEDFATAATAFDQLLAPAPGAGRTGSDLRDEAETQLVRVLARGGLPAFDRYLATTGEQPHTPRILRALAVALTEASLFREAVDTDLRFLERYPEDARALAAAGNALHGLELARNTDEADRLGLVLAPRFLTGSVWTEANDTDSLRTAGDAFARRTYETIAHRNHLAGREGNAGAWDTALLAYRERIGGWPEHSETPELTLQAAEAALGAGRHAEAIDLYAAAARTPRLAPDADWGALAVADAWYGASAPADTLAGLDSLAAKVCNLAERFESRHPEDPRSADALWRRASLARRHDWLVDAAYAYARFADVHPRDVRALEARVAQGDVLVTAERYDTAAEAYTQARTLAVAAGADTLVARLDAAVPAVLLQHATRLEPDDPLGAARTYETVAARWPGHPRAAATGFRAGESWLAADRVAEAVAAWQRLITAHPEGALARDAHIRIAEAWTADHRVSPAVDAWLAFTEAYPEDPDAADALLRAIELVDDSGDAPRGRVLRLAYVDRFPGDAETSTALLADLVREETARFAPPEPTLTRHTEAPTPAPVVDRYLAAVAANPELGDPELLGRLHFETAEPIDATYQAVRLTQPLKQSLAVKREHLEATLAAYGRAAEAGSPAWARAAAYRMGAALVAFGEALENSDLPDGLAGDDLLAYRDVLADEAFALYEQGEAAWAELIRKTAPEISDAWLTSAQEALWIRRGPRFFYRPEVAFPVIDAERPTPDPTALALEGGNDE